MSARTHLIVTGTARSGTTALAELLNAHARVGIGIERFKFQYLLRHNFDAGLLERARFFDFREEDTNLRPDVRPAWREVYEEIARKWDSAAVIGDKVPDMAPVLEDYLRENPDFRCIYILRNLKDVGLSWQARADRPRDRWPAGRGFVRACRAWEEHTRIIHDIVAGRAHRNRMLILDYDAIYQPEARTVPAILGFLGLDEDAQFARTWQQHVKFFAGRRRRKVPPKFVEAYRAVDQRHARGLRKHAREQLELWAGRFAAARHGDGA